MDTLATLFNISIVVFVVTTMLSMGLAFRVADIAKPLKNLPLVMRSLLSNFVFVPVLTLALVSFLPLDEGVKIGLIILSLSAGAPFLPKLAEIAKSNTALATAHMLLLMVATVVVLPFALPFMLDGDVSVDSLSIAKSLVVMMIIPLGIAMYVKVKAGDFAKKWQIRMVKLSNLTLLLIVVLLVVLNGQAIFNTTAAALVSVVLFILFALLIGYFSGGKEYENKVVISLATAQRNISAALVVGAQNFKDPEVSIIIIAVSVIGLVLLLLSAKKYKI